MKLNDDYWRAICIIGQTAPHKGAPHSSQVAFAIVFNEKFKCVLKIENKKIIKKIQAIFVLIK